MPFPPDRETRLVDIEFDRSKICSSIFYSRWTKLVNRNCIMSVTTDDSLKLCRHFPAFLLFLWQSICRVVRKLKSCHRVTLPSQLNGRYCMKKKKMANVHFLHSIVSNLSLPYISQGDHFILPRGLARSRLPSSVFFWTEFLFPCRSVLHTGVN